MTTTQNDDDLIIIEDNDDDILDLGESTLVELDNTETEELISFDGISEIKEKDTIDNIDLWLELNLNNNSDDLIDLNSNFSEDKIDLNLESNLNLNVENNIKLNSSDDLKLKLSSNEESLNTETDNKINLNLSLEENIDLTSSESIIEEKTEDIALNNNEETPLNLAIDSLNIKEDVSSLDLNIIQDKKEITEEKKATEEVISDFSNLEENIIEKKEVEINSNENETLNTILDWTINKLANRKSNINTKISSTQESIKEIEIEVKKLQEERKTLLAEVRELTSENKKIDDSIESLENMK